MNIPSAFVHQFFMNILYVCYMHIVYDTSLILILMIILIFY